MNKVVKKLVSVMAVSVLVLAGCAQQAAPPPAPPAADPPPAADAGQQEPAEAAPAADGGLTSDTIRIAFVHVGDPADMGYTYRQHRGTMDMMIHHGISESQVLNFFNIPPGSAADTAILEAIEWGADMVFATSFGHGPHMLEAAREFPDVLFFHATGDLALDAGLPNFHNYFGNMSQARYLSGIAAGLMYIFYFLYKFLIIYLYR